MLGQPFDRQKRRVHAAISSMGARQQATL